MDKKIKVLLVSSSFEGISLITASKNKETGLKTDDSSHYPLGLAYLHSALEAKNFEVETLFLNNQYFDYCREKIFFLLKNFQPEIIGFQILTGNRTSSFNLIEEIHEKYPEIKMIIGGVHATLMHCQILGKYNFLIAALGEGETTFPELAEKLTGAADPDLESLKGIAYFKDGRVIKTPDRELIENLDTLPFPKHEIFFRHERKVGNILTSRGCPFACSFCCLDTLSRRKVRKRSVANLMEEIEMMIKKFPRLETIWIHDDSFFLDNDRVIEFCDEVIKRGIKLNFTCSGRFKPLKKEMVEKLERANFKKVMFGLESGDEGILKKCHKGIIQADAINAYQLFSQSKINIYSFLIVGLPGENEKTIMETARLIKRLQKIKYTYYNEDIAILTIYPGTEIYEIAKTAGAITDDFWLTDQPTPLFTVENGADELMRLKELLLSHISLDRLFTLAGLKNQLTMLPFIALYWVKNPKNAKYIIFKALKSKGKKFSWSIKKLTDIIMSNRLFLKIKNRFYRSPHAKRVAIWKKDRGDKTLRMNYPLTENSLVFDVGGYEGQWASDIFSRYQSKIHVFEPVKKFADSIEERFKNNKNITVSKFGLGAKNEESSISLLNDSSTRHKNQGEKEVARFVDIVEYMAKNNIEKIDLMKINIEGGEYELLERVLEKGLAGKIMNLQIQFHDFIPEAKNRMVKIQEGLKKTHHLTYQYEFVWENWKLNE